MARILSRRASGRGVPRVTRAESVSPRRRDARSGKTLGKPGRSRARGGIRGRGTSPAAPGRHRLRIGAGKAYAQFRGMSEMDTGI